VNVGGDEGWPIPSDVGLRPIEQLIMQIATNDAQVNPTMRLLYGQFMTEEHGLLVTDASGAHLFDQEFLRISAFEQGAFCQPARLRCMSLHVQSPNAYLRAYPAGGGIHQLPVLSAQSNRGPSEEQPNPRSGHVTPIGSMRAVLQCPHRSTVTLYCKV
jgi:hypothetical protein